MPFLSLLGPPNGSHGFMMKKTSLVHEEEEFAFQVKLGVQSNDKQKHILKKLSPATRM
jgi:hypothetical protein